MPESLKELRSQITCLREEMNEMNARIKEVAFRARGVNLKIRGLMLEGAKTTGDPIEDLALIASWDTETENKFRELVSRLARTARPGSVVVVMRRERNLGITYETFLAGRLTSTDLRVFPRKECFEIMTEEHFLVTLGITRNIELVSKNISVKADDFDEAKFLVGQEAVEWVENSPRDTGLYNLIVRKSVG